MFSFVRDTGQGPSGLVSTLRRLVIHRPGGDGGGQGANGEATPPAPRPAREIEAVSEPPPDGLTLLSGAERVVLVAVFGLDAAALPAVVERIDREAAVTGVVPVFLTDLDDFQPFRERRARFEYLPPPAEGIRLAGDLDWGLYQARRLTLLCRKWRAVRVVAIGRAASDVLATWRAKETEDVAVTQLLAAANGAPITRRA